MAKRLSLEVKNKAENYRILRIEPFGYKYGMEVDEVFTLIFNGEEDFRFYIGDDSKEINFTLDQFEQLEIQVLSDGKEISTGHNILYN